MFSFLLLALLLASIAPLTRAQDTPPPVLTVRLVEPTQFVAGRGGLLSVYGTGFTTASTVRLVGFGLLAATFVHEGALTAEIPASIPTGTYGVEVSDATGGTASAPQAVTIVPAPTTPQPLPTFEPPTAVPSLPPPTPVPGQPSLIVRSFSASPSSIPQGGTTIFTFEVVNQGNRAALGVALALSTESRFSPANGQASILLPDLQPGASATVSLSVVAGMDTPAGPNDVVITMTCRDFEGKTFSTNAALGVTVTEANRIVQLLIAQYRVEPTPAVPGQPVLVTLSLRNAGNRTAAGVSVRVAGEGGLLIPSAGGDTVIVGDIEANVVADVTFQMIVRGDARRGPQPQPLTIAYVLNGEEKTINTTIGIEIAASAAPQPVILLDSFDTGEAVLTPGMRFTLSFVLRNVGNIDAGEMLVTFGSLDVSNPPPSDPNPTPGAGGNPDSSSNTTPSSSFAPVGSGNTIFAGALTAGTTMTLTQDFVVNVNVNSGIQVLPISVRYRTSDGAIGQTTLPASLIVVVPPRLQVDLADPLPPTVNVGEPLSVTLQINNIGRDLEVIQRAELVAENGEVLDGASTAIGVIRADDDASVNATVNATAEGTLAFTFRLHYLDDLNAPRTLDYRFTVDAVQPPPLPEPEFPPEPIIVPTPPPPPDNTLGELLLGLLGLGGGG
jgi:hypothetical protein